MKIYKVVWSTIDYKNSLEYGKYSSGMIPSNYIYPRLEKEDLYATEELAKEKINLLKAAAIVLGHYDIYVDYFPIEVKEVL